MVKMKSLRERVCDAIAQKREEEHIEIDVVTVLADDDTREMIECNSEDLPVNVKFKYVKKQWYMNDNGLHRLFVITTTDKWKKVVFYDRDDEKEKEIVEDLQKCVLRERVIDVINTRHNIDIVTLLYKNGDVVEENMEDLNVKQLDLAAKKVWYLNDSGLGRLVIQVTGRRFRKMTYDEIAFFSNGFNRMYSHDLECGGKNHDR